MDESLFKDFIEQEYLSNPPQNPPTFADVLNRDIFIPEKQGKEIVNIGIGRGWNEESTIKKRKSYFNNTFLPALNKMFGRNTPISTLTEQDYNKLLDKLAEKRTRNEKTRARDDRFIFLVLEAAAIKGDIAFNEYRGKSLYTPTDIERQVSPTLLKSLTPTQDMLIYRFATMDPATPHGELLGVFLMHMTGVRNGEAAGADFGDIRALTSGVSILSINKTAMQNTNERQLSGKTWNAVRDLPLKDIAVKFLGERRAFLEQEIAKGYVRDENGDVVRDVNRLPIACRGTNYATPCSPNDLSRVGKQVLMAAKVSDAEFRELDRYVKLGMYDEEGWDDKDPTSYVFRRSYATHLRLLGIPDSTRKYLIGHNTDDRLDTRMSYENEDKLNAIHELLKYHPINWLFHNNQAWEERSIDALSKPMAGKPNRLPHEVVSSNAVYRIKGTGETIVFDVEALQAIDSIEIEIKQVSPQPTKKPVSFCARTTGTKRKAEQHVNTSRKNVETYLRTLNKLVKHNIKLKVKLTKK